MRVTFGATTLSRRSGIGALALILLALGGCRETELTRMAAANDSGALNIEAVRVAGNIGVALDDGFSAALRDAVLAAVPRNTAQPSNALIEITVTRLGDSASGTELEGLARLRSLRGFTRAELDLRAASTAADMTARRQEVAATVARLVREEIAARGL